MGRMKVDYKAAAEGRCVPAGHVVEVEWESWDETISSKGRPMITVRFRIAEPRAYANLPIFERYAIGPILDPAEREAYENGEPFEVEVTGYPYRRLADGLDATNVAKLDLDDRLASAIGQRVLATVDVEVYNGESRNKIVEFYKLGTRPLGGPAPIGGLPVVNNGGESAAPTVRLRRNK